MINLSIYSFILVVANPDMCHIIVMGHQFALGSFSFKIPQFLTQEYSTMVECFPGICKALLFNLKRDMN